MLLYYLFWMLMGLFLHFYIIFGTNLLTGGPAQIVVFCLFQCFTEKEYQTEWNLRDDLFLEQTQSRRLGVDVKKGTRRPWGRRARPPPSWGPRGSPDRLLSPIYTHIPRKHPRAPQNPISTAATFCTQEIPSWGLFRSSAGGGIDHGGPLHQLHGPSNDVWVVYLRPSGP